MKGTGRGKPGQDNVELLLRVSPMLVFRELNLAEFTLKNLLAKVSQDSIT
jgi:hypothetical protein